MTAEINLKKVDREVKVVLVGESGVGKSSIALRFVNNNFKTITASTIGASFLSKAIIHRGLKIRYNIWDTAGQEKYRSLASMYYKGAECAIIAYDVTNRDSFLQAQQYWITEVDTQLGRNPCLCLAANKADLVEERVISEEEGMAFAQSRGAAYFETSAKTDLNVSDMFNEIAGRLPSNEGPGFDRTNTYSLGHASKSTPPPGQSTGSRLLNFCC